MADKKPTYSVESRKARILNMLDRGPRNAREFHVNQTTADKDITFSALIALKDQTHYDSSTRLWSSKK